MPTLVLLRHGESTWNRENRFTGWTDVELTSTGVDEARRAGQWMLEAGVLPDVTHTSMQSRAIRTALLGLEEMGRLWIPVHKSWRLNERHYGDLQGLDKAETREKYGDAQFMLWRRSFDVPPPALSLDDERHPRFDPRYRDLAPDVLPATECLRDVIVRSLPYWYDAVVPDLRAGKVVLLAAHGNSLRALIKHLEHISDDDIVGLNVPTGFPRVYELDDELTKVTAHYLPDDETAAAAAEAVANQGKKAPEEPPGHPGDPNDDITTKPEELS
jgi:2,3-bisphosphoglycerate-dependent phosphoglycerate mutase